MITRPSSSASSYLLSNSLPTSTITVNTIAADKTLGTITLPAAIQGNIAGTYLDVTSFYVSNTNGSANETDGAQYIQVSNGGAYSNAILLPSGSFLTAGSATREYSELCGSIDITSLITAGATITVKWANAKVLGTAMSFREFTLKLRVVVGG